MNKTTIVSVIVALIIGGFIGYSVKGSGSSSAVSAADAEKLQASITMMKDQASAMKTMSEMMKTNGMMMNEKGTKYKDESLMMGGKDMMTVADRYMMSSSSGSGEMMDHMMQ